MFSLLYYLCRQSTITTSGSNNVILPLNAVRVGIEPTIVLEDLWLTASRITALLTSQLFQNPPCSPNIRIRCIWVWTRTVHLHYCLFAGRTLTINLSGVAVAVPYPVSLGVSCGVNMAMRIGFEPMVSAVTGQYIWPLC